MSAKTLKMADKDFVFSLFNF